MNWPDRSPAVPAITLVPDAHPPSADIHVAVSAIAGRCAPRPLKVTITGESSFGTYDCLEDCGAEEVSCIDPDVLKGLGIPISEVSGTIEMANGSKVPRRRTPPIEVEFLIGGPKPRKHTLTHVFEVLERNPGRPQVIVGRDVLYQLFKEEGSMPLIFITPPSARTGADPAVSELHSRLLAINAIAVSPRDPALAVFTGGNAWDAPCDAPTIGDQATRLPCLPKEEDRYIPDSVHVAEVTVQPEAVEVTPTHESDVLGETPPDEWPSSLTVSTPAEHEVRYATERARVLADLKLLELLTTNERIIGFCSDESTHIQLVLKENAQLKYQRPYPVPDKLVPAVDAVVHKWLANGKIERAPAGCPYNNPLAIALKYDEDGRVTGVRPCVDFRQLNQALLVADGYPIPTCRSIMGALSGCSIFGSFDLSDAFLQFMVKEDSRKLTAFWWGGVPVRLQGLSIRTGVPTGVLPTVHRLRVPGLPLRVPLLRQPAVRVAHLGGAPPARDPNRVPVELLQPSHQAGVRQARPRRDEAPRLRGVRPRHQHLTV